jgi:adenine phosphoribosyltransferase
MFRPGSSQSIVRLRGHLVTLAQVSVRILPGAMTRMTQDILARFRWVDGHADVWRLFSDGDLFPALVRSLADPFRASSITKVVGIEARGFILGGAVASELGAGFVAIRKPGGLFPGEKLVGVTSPDYRSQQVQLRLQRKSLGQPDRVVIIDDWFETGNQALTAKALIESAGASFVGASVIVDQLNADVRSRLQPFHALITREALGADTD